MSEILFLGLALSIPYGLGSWLKWQTLKGGTVLSAGAVTQKHGDTLGWLFQLPCYALLISYCFGSQIGLAIGAFIVMWFISGGIAKIIERRAYQTDKELDLLADMSSSGHVIPQWWLALMSEEWKTTLRKEVAARTIDEE